MSRVTVLQLAEYVTALGGTRHNFEELSLELLSFGLASSEEVVAALEAMDTVIRHLNSTAVYPDSKTVAAKTPVSEE